MAKAKLNIDLLKRLRTRFLRMRHRKHFRMEDVIVMTNCGAAMCIAGHALDLEGYRSRWNQEGQYFQWFTPNGRLLKRSPMDEAQRLLGLSYNAAQYCGDEVQDYQNAGLFMRFDLRTPKQAARVIQSLIDSTEVNKQ